MELIYVGGGVQGCCSWTDTWRHYWQVMENQNPFRWPCPLSRCIFLTAFYFHLHCLFFKFICLQQVITLVVSDKGVLYRHAENVTKSRMLCTPGGQSAEAELYNRSMGLNLCKKNTSCTQK